MSETIAVFKSSNKKKFTTRSIYNTLHTEDWPLEVSFYVNDDYTRGAKAYYNGSGKHPMGGNLDNKTIERKEFAKNQKQESLDYLEELINKYDARVLDYAEPEITDHWSGTKVILRCEDEYNYITTTLFDKCGLTYSDDFRGTKNYRGEKPEPTPLYISDSPEAFVNFFVTYDSKGNKVQKILFF